MDFELISMVALLLLVECSLSLLCPWYSVSFCRSICSFYKLFCLIISLLESSAWYRISFYMLVEGIDMLFSQI